MWKFETTHGRMDSRIAWQDTRGARKTIRPIGKMRTRSGERRNSGFRPVEDRTSPLAPS